MDSRRQTLLLRTLLYHRIESSATARPDLAPDLVSATPALFEQHLRYLARFYEPITGEELVNAVTCGQKLPPGAVVVTFDDGYRDFLEIAWPLLKQHHIPAILFVCTRLADDPGRTFWWDTLWQLLSRTSQTRLDVIPRRPLPLNSPRDRSRAFQTVAEWLKRLRPADRVAAVDFLAEQLGLKPERANRSAVLSWPELRQLAGDGLSVASHGRDHELLDQLGDAELTHEVQGSRDDLLRQISSAVPLFAYPNGNFDDRSIRAVDRAGYRAAFTTLHGSSAIPGTDPRTLRRDGARVSLLRLAVNLFGPVAVGRALKHPLPKIGAGPVGG